MILGIQYRCSEEEEEEEEEHRVSITGNTSPLLICFLTFSPLPLLHDCLQPFLFLLRGLGHADEPLVLGRVVDLPAVVHDVPTAVVVSCGGKGVESPGGF